MTNPAVLPEDDGEAWLILYEDADQKHELFSGCGATDAAHSRFEQLSITWSCHLFRRVALTLPEPTPDPRETTSEAHERCSRCQGNGEIVRNWKRYQHPRAGDKGDEAVAECPDCDGTGTVPSPRAEAAEIAQIAADRDAERASAISFHEEANRLRDSLARANAERDRLAIENETLVSGMTQLAERAVASSTVALAEIDRLRTFIRSARGIVQHFASENPKHIWGGHEQDPLGAHAWLAAESAEVGTSRDGGDPKVEKRT